MTSSTRTYKSVWLVSLVAAIAATAAAVGAALEQYPVATLAIATSGFLLLIMARDYTPRRRVAECRISDASLCPAIKPQRFPLAS